MDLTTIWHIIFGTLFVWILFFLIRAIFQTIRWDFWKSWTSELNEKNEKNIIRDESNTASDSNNAMLCSGD